jgi:hypothetical protein
MLLDTPQRESMTIRFSEPGDDAVEALREAARSGDVMLAVYSDHGRGVTSETMSVLSDALEAATSTPHGLEFIGCVAPSPEVGPLIRAVGTVEEAQSAIEELVLVAGARGRPVLGVFDPADIDPMPTGSSMELPSVYDDLDVIVQITKGSGRPPGPDPDDTATGSR